MAIFTPTDCYHGGAFFGAIGDEFDTLERAEHVISADVLDAWFDPSPGVLEALRERLPWLLRTSPPTGCDGLVRVIARTRGVDEQCILAGGGSSDLIFLALTRWLDARSRVLILDPMYGEYAHVLERVVGCTVDRFVLCREDDYDLDVEALSARVWRGGYDLVIVVNPNSPTGRHCRADEMRAFLDDLPRGTRVWIDETYVEYAGDDQSLEVEASERRDVIVCKSMSKVYALSGARVGYLCASPEIIGALRPFNPPWAVSLVAQVAGVAALQDESWYRVQWQRTHELRAALSAGLEERGFEVVPSVANFVLCQLPFGGVDARTVIDLAREQGLYLRDVSSMGSQMGARALRVAVKDAETNARMLHILGDVLQQTMG